MNPEDFRRAFMTGGVLAGLPVKKVPAETLVYSEGDRCEAISFVLSGGIRVFKTGESGREITLYEIGPGETCILNASCILAGRDYPANAVVTEDLEALVLPAPEFRSLMQESSEFRGFIFSVLSGRLAEVMALVEEVAFGKMDRRVLDYVREKAAGGAFSATHQAIANDLGTSREVVSRILKDFERRGVLCLSRNSIRLIKAQS